MNRVSALIVVAAATLIAVPAVADSKADHKHAGKKGYVSAYAADESTVIDVQSCDLKDRAHDYVECGKSLRERVKKDLCDKKGKGNHTWYYQVSDNAKSKQTAFCK